MTGQVQIDTTGISLLDDSGLPELRYFKGCAWNDSDRIAFQYCCANAPKLEQIKLAGSFESTEAIEVVENTIGQGLYKEHGPCYTGLEQASFQTEVPIRIISTVRISLEGPLISRTSLRTLEIDIRNVQNLDRFEKFMRNLFFCPDQKPNLENLTLRFGRDNQMPSLSSLYGFVNGNFNLKTLSLTGMNDEKKIIEDLIRILNCNTVITNNGLEVEIHGNPEAIEKLKQCIDQSNVGEVCW